MFHLAAGLSPYHLKAASPLSPILDQVSLVEMGLSEAHLFQKSLPISLHIARSPISEDSSSQDFFIDHLKNQIQILENEKGHLIQSIGFHLSGHRFEDMGLYGLTSHFEVHPQAIGNSIRFIRKAQDSLNKQIWIENANFYSRSSKDILKTWQVSQEIIRKTKSRMILDLSHLVIDCHNSGGDPLFFLGATDFSLITELHLSGIKTGKDGTFHDGHSEPVHNQVWSLLAKLVELKVLTENENIYFNLEHTDPEWIDQVDAYHSDFQKLSKILNGSADVIAPGKDRELYAKSFLKKIILRQVPSLESYMEKRKLNFNRLFDVWIAKTLVSPDQRLALNPSEIPSQERQRHILAAESFIAFLRSQEPS